MPFDLIVVGGGAAGFFGAIQSSEMKPGLKVLILEKSSKLLSKVRISGGGRCNVTHQCLNPFDLSKHYPRGQKALKNLFPTFHVGHMIEWLHAKGVSLKTEQDGRMFPITDSSETIIECFLKQAEKQGIKILRNKTVTGVENDGHILRIFCADGETFESSKILITTGGSSSRSSYDFIHRLGHSTLGPIPSLFTFNDSEKNFRDLMGISVPSAQLKIAGTKFFQEGPLLITHWGLSGPATIKLSAWAAEFLNEVNYEFTVLVNWVGKIKEEALRLELEEMKKSKKKQKIKTNPLYLIPQRLWSRLCEISEVDEGKCWSEVSQRTTNKLVESLIRCPFHIKGKTTFKEEFVTCGGVDLKEVNLETMESKIARSIYFAGEVLNIDGETGGFNFQSAWTTAFIAAKAITHH
jgi:predicted Rossmann fold flavoprotein